MVAMLAFCIAFTTISFTSYKANAEIAIDTFQLVNGAFIRPEDPMGIRFEVGISEAQKTALEDTYGEENVEFGILISTDEILNGEELTLDTTKNKVQIVGEKWLTKSSLTTEETKFAGFYGTLVGGSAEGGYVNFEKEYYSEVFVARGYLTVNGENYYTNVVERTLAGTAKMADENVEPEQQKAIDKILSTENESYIKKVTLTYKYNDDGVTADKTQTLVKGVVLTAPTTSPTKSGKIFGGWVYENGQAAFNGEIIKADTTVYANWVDSKSVGVGILSRTYSSATTYSYEKVDMPSSTEAVNLRKDTFLFTNGIGGETSSTPYLNVSSRLGNDKVSGNYLVIDVYIESAPSTFNFGGYGVYDIENKLVETSTINQIQAKTWYKVLVSVDKFLSSNYIDLGGGSQEVKFYVSDISVITPTEYANTFKQTDKLTLLNTTGATLEVDQETGNYIYTQTTVYASSNFVGLRLNNEALDGKIVSCNYIVIKAKGSKDYYFAATGRQGNACYKAYDATDFSPLERGRAHIWCYLVYNCNVTYAGELGAKFGIPDSMTLEIASINVYTSDEYKIFESEHTKTTEKLTLINTTGATLTKDKSTGNYIYSQGNYAADDINQKAYLGLKVNSNAFEKGKVAEGNYIVMKVKTKTAGWVNCSRATSSSSNETTYTVCDLQMNTIVDNTKTLANEWCYIFYKLDAKLNTYFGWSYKAVEWEFESIDVFTQDEYNTFVAGCKASS